MNALFRADGTGANTGLVPNLTTASQLLSTFKLCLCDITFGADPEINLLRMPSNVGGT